MIELSVIEELILEVKRTATVKVDRLFPWVSIESKFDPEISAFLQGREADEFIDRADQVWEREDLNLCRDESYELVAYDYLDLLLP